MPEPETKSAGTASALPIAARAPRRDVSRRTVSLFLAGLAAFAIVVLIGGYVAASAARRASVVIDVKDQRVTASTLVWAGTGPAPDGLPAIPATPVTVEVTVDKTIPTTGVAPVGVTPATGEVVLVNPTDAAVTIPAGTVGTGDTGLAFTFDAETTVPVATDDTPGQATAAITMSVLGTGGNLGVGELSGRLESGVYFSNRMEALSGGTDDENGRAVAEADLDALRQATDAAAPGIAQDQLAATLPAGSAILAPSLDLGEPEVTFDHAAGDGADSVAIHAVYTVSGLTYDAAATDAALRERFLPLLTAATPAGFTIDPASVRLGDPGPSTDAGSEQAGTFSISASATAVAQLPPGDEAALEEAIAGQSRDDAEGIIRANPAIDDVRITVSPGWIPGGVPDDTGRIDIRTEE